jgi:NTE family protein
VIDSFKAGARLGILGYARVADYGLADALPCPVERALDLAKRQRLERLDTRSAGRLINWGYAVCDAAIRKHVIPSAGGSISFPYPASGV